jgi:hypothetical protein
VTLRVTGWIRCSGDWFERVFGMKENTENNGKEMRDNFLLEEGAGGEYSFCLFFLLLSVLFFNICVGRGGG